MTGPFQRFEVGAQEGLGSLARVTHPGLEPGPGQVVVKMKAAALNHRDLMIMNQRYGAVKPQDRVPGADGAGEVIAVGSGVTSVSLGDRVTAPHFVLWEDGDYNPSIFAQDIGNTADGWLAEHVLIPAAAAIKLPGAMSYEDAAALGAAAITAWTVLETLGQIKAGDTVLTLGTGGVSMMALQIAGLNGARVAITSSSDAKLETARDLGADITVNYRSNPDWHEAVREATGGRGVDIVVETVGQTTLPQSVACCAPNARVGLLGALGGSPQGPTNLGGLIGGNIIVKGITSGSRRMHEDLLVAFQQNGARPKIDRIFDFEETVAAYEYLDKADFVGKIVIRG